MLVYYFMLGHYHKQTDGRTDGQTYQNYSSEPHNKIIIISGIIIRNIKIRLIKNKLKKSV